MNRLSILLVIAFVSYSLATSQNDVDGKPVTYAGEYLDSYEIGYGNVTETGRADITLKIHTAPYGAVKMDGMPWGKLVCGAKCAVSCIKGKNTSACLKCMAGCLLE